MGKIDCLQKTFQKSSGVAGRLGTSLSIGIIGGPKGAKLIFGVMDVTEPKVPLSWEKKEHVQQILSILKDKKIIDITHWIAKSTICISCQMGTSCKLPFQNLNRTAKNPLEKFHCDLWGPMPLSSHQIWHHYVIFVDDFSRCTWLYPL